MTRLLSLLSLSWGLLAMAGWAQEWTAAQTTQLLATIRRPPVADCWLIMGGTAKYRATGKETVSLPLELRGRFTPALSEVQLVFSGHERYRVRQDFAAGAAGTSVVQEQAAKAGQAALADVGIQPGDITFSFLFWDFKEDQGAETVKGNECRILHFQQAGGTERARVWVSTRYGMPMQVQWFRGTEQQPWRQLEIVKVRRVDDIWVVSAAKVSSPTWKTMVTFDDVEVKRVGETPAPVDLFLPAQP
jgi:hypothetical protein